MEEPPPPKKKSAILKRSLTFIIIADVFRFQVDIVRSGVAFVALQPALIPNAGSNLLQIEAEHTRGGWGGGLLPR